MSSTASRITSGYIKTLWQFTSKIYSRMGQLFLGHTVNKIIDYCFEYLLYPFVIWKLGPLVGGAIMSLASLIVCLLCLGFYDWSKRDWLGIEAVKSLRDSHDAKGMRKYLSRVLSAGSVWAFIGLSLYTDPFITTAYMRHTAFNGMGRRDWAIFLGSWLIGNAEWILILSGGIWIIKSFIA